MSEYFTQAAVITIALYLICSISFSTSFLGSQQLAFPSVNNLSSTNTAFLFLTLSLFAVITSSDSSSSSMFGAFSNSFYSSLFQTVLFFFTFCFLWASREFVSSRRVTTADYDLILTFSVLGLAIVNLSNDFLMFYLAIELQSLCFYSLAALNKSSEFSAEASIKYFVLGALSSGLLLLGFALYYASLGAISFEFLERLNVSNGSLAASCACLLFSIALLFKLGSFPFHKWLCDVYDGSIINVTAFFSSIPKLILISFFFRVVYTSFADGSVSLDLLIIFSALGSICFAAVAALYQKRLKRLLAYSAISHTGFLLMAIHCSTVDSMKACTIYIVLYAFTTLALFSVLFLSGINNSQQKFIVGWASFFERNAALSLSLALLLWSIAGIPPLSGFYSKLCILLSILSKSYVTLAVIIAFFSSISCFYYIKVIKVLYFTQERKTFFWLGSGTKSIEFFTSISLIIVTLFLLRPNLLIDCSAIAAVSLL